MLHKQLSGLKHCIWGRNTKWGVNPPIHTDVFLSVRWGDDSCTKGGREGKEICNGCVCALSITGVPESYSRVRYDFITSSSSSSVCLIYFKTRGSFFRLKQDEERLRQNAILQYCQTHHLVYFQLPPTHAFNPANIQNQL